VASLEPFQTYVGGADGLAGAFGSIELAGSAGMRLRRMLNPAPLVGLNSMSSACCRGPLAEVADRVGLAERCSMQRTGPRRREYVRREA
jgi:hypothetical protein